MITIPSKDLIREEIKSFMGKQKLREFSTTKPALQQILQRLTQPVNTREKKDLQKQTQNNQENANVSIITLNVNGLNALTKNTD